MCMANRAILLCHLSGKSIVVKENSITGVYLTNINLWVGTYMYALECFLHDILPTVKPF